MMAGISLELRRLMRKNTVSGMVQTYTYAGLVGSGPWVISIIAILVIGLFTTANPVQSLNVQRFQVSISYLMAGSLILTGPLQIVFTRYVADRIFEKRSDLVLPNLMGALCITLLASTAFGSMALLWFDGSFVYRLCMLTSFSMLSCIWILQIFASAIHSPSAVVLVFALGYTITVGAALWLRDYGLEGLLAGFIGGQATMFFILLNMIVKEFPAKQFIAFSFLRKTQIFPTLAITGLFYNLGVWSDKFIFWADTLTGVQIIAPLRASPIYDFPIFLAYLSIIPGMAVFFVRMEVDVADQCHRYYKTVTKGGTYTAILEEKRKLVEVVTSSLLDMAKVQVITTLIVLLCGGDILRWFGMSQLYRPLFSVDLIAVGMQLVVLAMLSVFFYLDRRKLALALCVLFFAANTAFSLMSLYAGPRFYGYGFAVAVLLTAILGAFSLSRTFERLEYETFMLQTMKF
ncbi:MULTISPECIES: exopolysaccharide Pel transporter PelG [unclassified Massilia]|uniref:exopolysaccharide Pel transporter PelG n=1 Tax=unclassified Massilia TaxID=2609279 RepID=UPI001E41EBB8|nr:MULTISPECIES: exopolysaccharide Pel transporter PelG [unclassified Massilia]